MIRRIGFVGVGKMGLPMAGRLRDAGFEVLVADRSLDIATAAAESCGAEAAASLTDLAVTDLIVCMLPSSDAVDAVLDGSDGLFASLPSGARVVDMGSSDPLRTRRLGEIASRRRIAFADAPVSGGVARAVSGDLTIMFGGDEELFAALQDVLAALGSTIVRVGEVGAGHAMKALNNLLSAVGLAAACEVIAAGVDFGLDPATMLAVLNRSTGKNNATETKVAQFVLSESYASGFGLRLMVKDLRTALDLIRSEGLNTPIAEANLRVWERAALELAEDADHTMVAKTIGRRSGP